MVEPTLLDHVPLWAFVLVTLGMMLAAGEAGHRFGRFRGRKPDGEKEVAVGAIVGGTIGLLAFMQAFTFGLAAARWDSRRQVVLDEVNAIGTTYLRAAMLPDPHGSNVRVLLREYVEVRLERLEQPNAQVGDIIRKSEKLHTKLWAEAVKAARTDNSDITALFVDSLNQVIDLHTKRVTAGIRGRVPATIWGALIFLSIVGAFGLGHHAGLAGSSRSVAGLGMVLSFVVVMWLIADLDRPLEEMLRVNQQAMVDLRETMKNDAP